MKNVEFKKISVFEGPKQSPGFLLWHVSTAWRSSMEAVLKPLGLTHPQFVVLASLGWLTRNGDPVTQAAVGELAGLDPNTISQIIKGLEQKGMLRRKTSKDARAKNPFLTAKGKASLKKALPAVEKTDGEFFQILADKQMQSLLAVFQSLLPRIQ